MMPLLVTAGQPGLTEDERDHASSESADNGVDQPIEGECHSR